jgi:hypothetical protein
MGLRRRESFTCLAYITGSHGFTDNSRTPQTKGLLIHRLCTDHLTTNQQAFCAPYLDSHAMAGT